MVNLHNYLSSRELKATGMALSKDSSDIEVSLNQLLTVVNEILIC